VKRFETASPQKSPQSAYRTGNSADDKACKSLMSDPRHR
jgi:hypothetical protein